MIPVFCIYFELAIVFHITPFLPSWPHLLTSLTLPSNTNTALLNANTSSKHLQCIRRNLLLHVHLKKDGGNSTTQNWMNTNALYSYLLTYLHYWMKMRLEATSGVSQKFITCSSYYISFCGPELMKLIFPVLYVSRTMSLTRCYKTERKS